MNWDTLPSGAAADVPLGAEVRSSATWAGSTVPVRVEVWNSGGASPGDYDVDATATSGSIEAHGSGKVHVLGDTIEFSPGTSAEEPWLSEDGGSQLDGAAFDGRGRFTDNERFFVYRFELPADVTGGTLSLWIGNQFHVEASTDGSTWRQVLHEDREIRDLSNRDWRDLDLNELRGSGRTVYPRCSDSFTSDGWGAWLGRTKLVLQR